MINILPHIYALFLCIIAPLQERGLRKQLSNMSGLKSPSEDWIERLIFETTMKDFINAPLIALLSTIVTTLNHNKIELTAICVFVFVGLVVSFSTIKSNWEPWDLNRPQNIVKIRLGGRMITPNSPGRSIIYAGKLLIVIVTAAISIYASYF
jgi:hypothetical protein